MLNDRKRAPPQRHSAEQGSFLLEALISVAIFSIGVLGIVGLQAVSIQNQIHAKYRADASFFANRAISERAVGAFTLATWQANIAAALPNGTGTVTIAGNQVTVAVTWRMPSEAQAHNFTTIGRICANPAVTTC